MAEVKDEPVADLAALRSGPTWKWYGYAGHFIGGPSCTYHLSTRVGGYLISTVGDYRPYGNNHERQTIGAGADSFYETYVFRVTGEDDGNPTLVDWSEIDGERYAESLAAEAGHYRYCWKYDALGEANV